MSGQITRLSHWDFLNQKICKDVVRYSIQSFLLPTIETSKIQLKKVLTQLTTLHRKWQLSLQSHIIGYYCDFHYRDWEDLLFLYDLPVPELSILFSKHASKLPPRLHSFASYVKDPDDKEFCLIARERHEVIVGNESGRWAKSLTGNVNMPSQTKA